MEFSKMQTMLGLVLVVCIIHTAPTVCGEFNITFPTVGVRLLPKENTTPCSGIGVSDALSLLYRGTQNNYTVYVHAPVVNGLITPLFFPTGGTGGNPVATPLILSSSAPGERDILINFPASIALVTGVLQFEYDTGLVTNSSTFIQCIDVAVADFPSPSSDDDVIVLGLTPVPFSLSLSALVIGLCLLCLLCLFCCRRRRKRRAKAEAAEAAAVAAATTGGGGASKKRKRRRKEERPAPVAQAAPEMDASGTLGPNGTPRRTRVHKRTKTRVIDGPDGTKIIKKIVEVVESSDEWGSTDSSSYLDSGDGGVGGKSTTMMDPETVIIGKSRYGSSGDDSDDDSSYEYEDYDRVV